MYKNNPNYEIAELFYRLNIGAPVEEGLVARTFQVLLTDPNVKARDAQLGAMLTGLMVKGPTVREVVTLIRTALNIDGVTRYKPTLPIGQKLVGVAGSGKKGCKTFNISTTACLVASAAGVYVAKPCALATSSVSGSKDFINIVGAKFLEPNEMIEVLLATGFGIFPIEELIPRFNAVYGGRTFGPTPLSFALPAIVNPIACDAVLYGLSHPNIGLSLSVFQDLGQKNVMVVSSSSDGIHFIDELSTVATNWLGRIENSVVGEVNEFSPTNITLKPASKSNELKSGASIIENAQLATQILQGKKPGALEDTIAMNTACILLIAEKVLNLKEGFDLAIEVIRSGAGFKKLQQFIDATGGSRQALSTIVATGGIS